jgi:hypothetical protein
VVNFSYMLPDFPKSREELRQRLLYHVKMQVQQRSVFASLGRQFTQHEGRGFTYEQIGADEEKRTVESAFEEIRSPLEFRFADVPKLIGNARVEKLNALAEDIARQQSALAYRVLDETTRKAGTAIDGGVKPMTKELFLHAEECREMDIDPVTGDVQGVFVAHPDMAEALQRLWEEWQKDKAFMKAFNEIRDAKREAWRDRESHRKLVD